MNGPRIATDLAQAVLALQHLIRYAHRATLNAGDRSMPDPEDTAQIVLNLVEALGGLPQLCGQLATCAERFAADPALRAAASVDRPAAVQAGFVAEALRKPASATARLRHLAHTTAAPLKN